ncbi:MAG: flagellar M-ring protein FliF [Bryobacterales bacterium]|nr:flagellar M-ring protein FliF [Bryobacterales bacterium]
MTAIRTLYARLTPRQRVLLGAVLVLLVSGGFWLAHWNRERDFKPIYSGLAAEDAGAVVSKVRESGVPYRLLENGSTVLVPSSKVAELRLQMASAGLPKTGRIGFELFDKANFGTTDFAEQVNYHRALEGELERSITSLAEVEQGRVHITFAKDSVFTESRQPAKASVLVKLRFGARLSPQNVQSITYLVASAVEGLDPGSVSVLDMQGNLLSRPRHHNPDGPDPDDASIEYRQKIEKDLLAKINTTLEPLLGADRFRAAVSVECDFSSGEQSEELFDPAKSVMVSSQKSEDTSGASGPAGIPGTASALPRPAARGAGTALASARRTENIAYQTSRVVKRTKLPQGEVKRISVAMLLDHAIRWEGAGVKAKRIVEPVSAERLKAVHDIVAAVIGFRQDRGDQVTVEAQPFESTLNWEPAPAGSAGGPGGIGPLNLKLPSWVNRKVLVLGAVAGILLLLLLLAAFALLLKRPSKKKAARGAKAGLAGKGALRSGDEQAELPAAPDVKQQLEAKLAEQAAKREMAELEAVAALKLPAPTTKKSEVLARHLSEEAKKDPEMMAQILRTWLNDAVR